MTRSAPEHSSTREAEDVEDAVPNLSHRQILTILVGLMSGMFLAALDQTIVSTAARTIADDLQSLSAQAWITTAYMITATISTPLYGKLSDIYGRKPFYLAAISIFLIGSIASAFAESMSMLAVSRGVQGLGAGGLMSLALTILGDIVTPRQRAKYQGYFLAVFGTATVVGPLVGGFFAGAETVAGVAGWRWVFLINVPLGAIALFVVAKVLNVPHQRQKHNIDWGGAAALITMLIPLLLVSQQGREWGWGSSDALICYGIGAVGLISFLLIENRMKDAALVPLRLFRNGTFSVAIGGGFIVGIAMFGAIMLIPQYLQIVQGYSPTESGLLMLPLMIGMMSATLTAGQLTSRTGRYKVFPVAGTAVLATGMLLFTRVEWNSPIWQPMVYMAVIGIGLGGCMQTLMIAVQNAGPRKDMGVSTATATFVRQTGGTVGVAAFLSILFSTLTGNIKDAFTASGVRPSTAMTSNGGNVMQDSSFLGSLPIEQAKPIYIGFTESITTVFYIGAGVAALACLVLLFMKEIPLSDGPSEAPAPEGDEPRDDEDATTTAGQADEPSVRRMDVVTDAELDAESDTERAPPLVAAGTPGPPEGNGRSELAREALTSAASGPANGSVLIVSADGHQPQASSLLIDDAPTTLDFTLTGSGELPGVAPLRGVARNESGGTVADARVTVLDAEGNVAAVASTDECGRYSIADLPIADYTVVASGYPPATSHVSLDGAGSSHDVVLGY